MTRDAADLPWRHPSFDMAPAPRLVTAARPAGVLSSLRAIPTLRAIDLEFIINWRIWLKVALHLPASWGGSLSNVGEEFDRRGARSIWHEGACLIRGRDGGPGAGDGILPGHE